MALRLKKYGYSLRKEREFLWRSPRMYMRENALMRQKSYQLNQDNLYEFECRESKMKTSKKKGIFGT